MYFTRYLWWHHVDSKQILNKVTCAYGFSNNSIPKEPLWYQYGRREKSQHDVNQYLRYNFGAWPGTKFRNAYIHAPSYHTYTWNQHIGYHNMHGLQRNQCTEVELHFRIFRHFHLRWWKNNTLKTVNSSTRPCFTYFNLNYFCNMGFRSVLKIAKF